ncbi:MAG TPA: hydroxymethylbilane synthase [Chitinophagaceae bacterium]|nr:hydroxymethylbilane synthase [Chitinophagaceae bacterium]
MKKIRIGTRESQLAVWQATHVQELLHQNGYETELVYIKSEGDIDLQTPLYEIGVQGIFTRSLDIALLNDRIDIAVHSMKDVPTQLAKGIAQAAVLKRASSKDILVYKGNWEEFNSKLNTQNSKLTIATSSVRRKAQWLHRYPHHSIDNLRGNVNTRLRKLEESDWDGAIFAAAGLERIDLRPSNSIDLDWMLPAPAQGAIMIACRGNDAAVLNACRPLNDADTELCTRIERDFLASLMGGCTTPISALAIKQDDEILFKGNICTPDGVESRDIKKVFLDTRSFITVTPVVSTALQSRLEALSQKEIVAVFTSKNAERAVTVNKDLWKVYSISNRPSAHNASDLADVIINDGIKEVVFFCGDKRRDELPDKLKQQGVHVDEIIVYNTTETPRVVAEHYDGVLFYSPSAVKSFFSLNRLPSHTICYAIGKTTGLTIKAFCTNEVVIGDFKKGII